jgi:hypothetical protein
MRIERKGLLDDLLGFALGGNGMVVGKPGIGKSYLLLQLKDKLVANNILCFIIKIDLAYDSSDDAIAAELGIEGDWLATLNSIELRNENKAILIFDAFDAARDEEKRVGFLKQIKKAKTLLKDKWNLLVSVRTYDATKSTDLTNLFSLPTTSNALGATRKITIGELNESEIQGASTNPNLFNYYLDSTAEFKEILHVPFFLKILETILSDYISDDLSEIKHYKSESQLLDFFWQKKINNTTDALLKEQFLLWFTKQLVSNKTLSIPKSSLVEQGEKTQFEVFDYLRSENILDEISLRSSRVSYAHNIFFDYAVNRLCLDHTYDSLLNFIEEDYSRAFFLRPSFVYFFTSIWYEDQKIFWDLYNQLSNNKRKEIQLFVRLIINSTIASQFANTDELKYVINDSEQGNESIRNILQSIRFIRKRTISQDVLLLQLLSNRLKLQFIFEFAFLLERAVNDVQDNLKLICGQSARNLLQFILDNRNSDNKRFLDGIGSSRGIELVAKTYSTNHDKSKEALQRIFPLINEPGFEIGYFTNLAEDIKYFVEYDAELVSEVYKTIFGHRETSTEKTQMGASVVMSLISDRRQDFEMCYYRLEKFFPTFMLSSPKLALLTGIEIVNNHVYDKKVRSSGYDQGFTFEYQGKICTFYPDYSSIWSDRQFSDKTEAIGQHIINFIGNLYAEKHFQEADELVLIYIINSKVGFLWKLLMQLANENPKSMFELIMPLVMVPNFLSSSEVSHEVRAFLEKSNSILSDEQVASIEEVIFKAYPSERELGIQAALSAIKPERLQTAKAKNFMAGKQTMENFKPYETSSSVTPYTTEEWLKDQGVDVADGHNADLTRLANYFDAFTHKFLNSAPDYQEYEQYLKKIDDIWEEITKPDSLPEDLKFTLLNAAAKTAAIAARNLENIPEADVTILKNVIIYSYNYVSKYDSGQHSSSAGSGYSPTPRIEAAEALSSLFVRDNDPEVLALYKDAITDNNAIVRYNAIKSLPHLFGKHFETYIELFFERLRSEKDSFNYAALLSAIRFKKGKIIEDGNAIIEIVNQNTHLFQQQNQFVDSYAELLLWFLEEANMPKAFDTLINGYQYRSFSNTVIFRLFKQIHTYEPTTIFHENLPAITQKLRVIDSYIDQAGNVLLNAKEISSENPDVDNALHVFDEIIMRLYFALESNQRINNKHSLPANEENRKEVYFLAKPLIEKVLNFSSQITDKGLLIGHTAHYLMQTLNSVISYDPKDILTMVAAVTRYSLQVGYTFDSFSIREIVSLTEKLLADHRELLLEEQSFQDLLSILEIHINSGWVDALELLWRLDEVFK